MTDFNNKMALITGGAGGIGLATARLWLDRGGSVCLVDVSAERLQATADTLNSDRVTTFESQLGSPQACASAIAAAPQPIHSLIHLAGTFEADDAMDPGSIDRPFACRGNHADGPHLRRGFLVSVVVIVHKLLVQRPQPRTVAEQSVLIRTARKGYGP